MNFFNKNKKFYPQAIDNSVFGKIEETITEEELKVIRKETLEEGEVICSKCEGVGFVDKIKSDNTSLYKGSCPKCHGTGKLDWIENVLGKKPDHHSSSSSGTSSLSMNPGTFSVKWSDVPSGLFGTSGTGIRDVIIKQEAEQMAKKIDDEILEMIKKGG